MLKYPYKLFTQNYNLYNQNDEQSHKITKPKTFSNVKLFQFPRKASSQAF